MNLFLVNVDPSEDNFYSLFSVWWGQLSSHCCPIAHPQQSENLLWEMAIFKPQFNSRLIRTSSSPTSLCSSVLTRVLCGAGSQQTNPKLPKSDEILVFLQLVLPLHGDWVTVLPGKQKSRTHQGLCVKLRVEIKTGKKRAANTKGSTKAFDARNENTCPQQQTLPAELCLLSDVVVKLWISFQSKSSPAWLGPPSCFSTLPTPPPTR